MQTHRAQPFEQLAAVAGPVVVSHDAKAWSQWRPFPDGRWQPTSKTGQSLTLSR